MCRTCSPTRSVRSDLSGLESLRRMPKAAPAYTGAFHSQGPFTQLDLEGCEEIARLDIDEVLRERHATLQARADFRDIVLETPQARELTSIDDDVVARDACLERFANDAFGDQKPRRLAVLARREHLADFGTADHGLERFRPEFARHPGADLVGQFVDHVVIFERDLLPVCDLARLGVGADVEADDRRAAR